MTKTTTTIRTKCRTKHSANLYPSRPQYVCTRPLPAAIAPFSFLFHTHMHLCHLLRHPPPPNGAIGLKASALCNAFYFKNSDTMTPPFFEKR